MSVKALQIDIPLTAGDQEGVQLRKALRDVHLGPTLVEVDECKSQFFLITTADRGDLYMKLSTTVLLPPAKQCLTWGGKYARDSKWSRSSSTSG